ncbi:transposase, degenerate [Trichonephila inaurata madagascariensis]|uniref:Transposase, degenerate n=1 Tax=Trichonephila inaurata madagascariensis TaxID=2747483 RepID=A0A8X6YYM9_9ARAC|nr:transposase, degenerate [Trichonephila inaurata madagascariensis]
MDADEVIKVELSSTCECRGRLQYAKPYIHQKVDFPGKLSLCSRVSTRAWPLSEVRKRRSSKLPEGVTSDTFGPRVKSIIAAFSGFTKFKTRNSECRK